MRADCGPLVPGTLLPTVSLIVQLLWLSFDTVKSRRWGFPGGSVAEWLRLCALDDRDSVNGQSR